MSGVPSIMTLSKAAIMQRSWTKYSYLSTVSLLVVFWFLIGDKYCHHKQQTSVISNGERKALLLWMGIYRS